MDSMFEGGLFSGGKAFGGRDVVGQSFMQERLYIVCEIKQQKHMIKLNNRWSSYLL